MRGINLSLEWEWRIDEGQCVPAFFWEVAIVGGGVSCHGSGYSDAPVAS